MERAVAAAAVRFAGLVASVALVMAAAASLLVGCGSAGRQATTVPLTFAVWGDVRPASAAWPTAQASGFKHVAADLGERTVDYSVAVGDYTYLAPSDSDGTIDEKYAAFLRVAAPLTRTRVEWVVGNHELLAEGGYFAAAYHKWLAAPSPTFYVRTMRRGVSLVVLDTSQPEDTGRIGFVAEGSSENTAQAKWLVTTLKALAARPDAWIIVALHHPVFDGKSYGYYAMHADEQEAVAALFARYGVDLVVQGDLHVYRRHVEPDGPTYVVQGTGGAPPDEAGSMPLDAFDESHASSVYGYTLFSLDARGLHGLTYAAEPGDWSFKVIDSFDVPERRAMAAASPAYTLLEGRPERGGAAP